jgi:hypothetical protein
MIKDGASVLDRVRPGAVWAVQYGMLKVEAFLYLIFPEAYNYLIAYNKCRERATGVDFLDLLQNGLPFLPFQLIHIDTVIPYPTAVQELLAVFAVATGT